MREKRIPRKELGSWSEVWKEAGIREGGKEANRRGWRLGSQTKMNE